MMDVFRRWRNHLTVEREVIANADRLCRGILVRYIVHVDDILCLP